MILKTCRRQATDPRFKGVVSALRTATTKQFGDVYDLDKKQLNIKENNVPNVHMKQKENNQSCDHLKQSKQNAMARTPNGCEECLQMGSSWVHLRLCLSCGHVGCCDQSINKHGTKHFHSTDHPVIRSYEPGENWKWCFVDEIFQQ